jgi:hypothetical protein
VSSPSSSRASGSGAAAPTEAAATPARKDRRCRSAFNGMTSLDVNAAVGRSTAFGCSSRTPRSSSVQWKM